MQTSTTTLEKIIALCKRRGFVFQSSEIYGGLNGVYDFGHLGTLMKHNIRNAWVKSLRKTGLSVLLFEGAIIGPEKLWEASGHVQNFSDPMVDCTNCKHRYRTDEINLEKPCPHCGMKAWTEARQFNMMFKTQIGAAADQSSIAYLRPETAQPIFAQFKNMMTTNRMKIPFGIAQIGKAFRNEITPKQFLFRMREFEQMEMEWFCKENQVDEFFIRWITERKNFYASIGITPEKIRLRPHGSDELAHYSTKCTDVEYEFPFGWKEIEGIADRGDYDLTRHSQFSGKDLSVHDEETKQSYVPHVVECSVGVDRLFLTLLFDAFHEDIVEGEQRTVLKLSPKIAPIKAAFLPLSAKLNEKLLPVYQSLLEKNYSVDFDESGSIGKRYRRQDEIGTPFCFTYDFESEATQTITVRNRDTTTQERIAIENIEQYLLDNGINY